MGCMYLRAAFICGLYVFEGRVYFEGRLGPLLFVGCMYLRPAFI